MLIWETMPPSQAAADRLSVTLLAGHGERLIFIP